MLTDKQLENRKKGLGASDSAIHMGYSTFKTPYVLYMEKRGLLEQEPDDALRKWGKKLEKVILENYEEEHECNVITPDTVYHKKHDFIFANLDGWVENEKVAVEAKTANAFVKKKWDKAKQDGIPIEYLIQIAKQCHLVDAAYGVVAVLIGGFEYMEFIYERDLKLENIIIEEDIKFWHCVKNGIEPPVKTSDDCKLKYKEVYTDKVIQANKKILNYYDRLADLKQQQKELKATEEVSKMRIMDFMKNNEYLHDNEGNVLVSWKANKKGTRVFNLKGSLQ